MEAQVKTALQNAGIDVQKTVDRFAGNEALLERFLKKFPQDKSFEQIALCMEKEPGEDLLKAAHTLKGLAANLGMVRLSELCEVIVRKLRAGEAGGYQENYEDVRAEYGRVLSLLHEQGLDA